MKKVPIAYQLYSARNDVQKDMAAVLRGVKALGYDGVEFAGFFGHSADEIREMLDQTGLIAISSHVPVADIEQDMFGTIAFHQKIGCRFIAIPYLADEYRPGAPGFAAMLKLIYRFGRLCRDAGIQLLYHNHDFEFVPFSGLYGFDFLYSAVPEDLLQTEIDVCWVHYAGEDPEKYIRKYAGRAPVIHLKDYVGRKGEGTPYGLIGQQKQADAAAFEFRPFGYGCVHAAKIVEAGVKAGAEWFVVEQDEWYQRTPLEAAAMSLATLRELGLK